MYITNLVFCDRCQLLRNLLLSTWNSFLDLWNLLHKSSSISPLLFMIMYLLRTYSLIVADCCSVIGTCVRCLRVYVSFIISWCTVPCTLSSLPTFLVNLSSTLRHQQVCIFFIYQFQPVPFYVVFLEFISAVFYYLIHNI